MKLISVLNEDLIFCNLKAADRRELYLKMLDTAKSKLEDADWDTHKILDEIIEREDSLMIPYDGVALPHLRLDGLDDLFVIIGVLSEPVKFKPEDVQPSRIVIMSLISEDTSSAYLKILSAFMRYLNDPAKLAALSQVRKPEHFLELLRSDDVTVKKNITAEDLMDKECAAVKATDSLSLALDLFNREKISILPVVDEHNHIIGELDATDVIKSFIPDYIFMMDSLKFLSSFEVFEKIFKEENRLSVREYMNEVKHLITTDMPLIQFTVLLARREAQMLFVVDSDRKLIGSISISNIIRKVLRG